MTGVLLDVAGLIKVTCTAAGTSVIGSGWAIGTTGILTALHTLEHHTNPTQPGLLTDDPGTNPLRRLTVQHNEQLKAPAVLVWADPERDLALLAVHPDYHQAWAESQTDLRAVLAEPSSAPQPVTATGYPTLTMIGKPGEPGAIELPEQIDATLRPGGGTPHQRPVDLISDTPANARLWAGMSGAVLHENNDGDLGRILGVITDAAVAFGGRRLYAAQLPDPDHHDLATALRHVGAKPVIEDHHAPRNRSLLQRTGPQGRPPRLADLGTNLAGLGPRLARTDLTEVTTDQPHYPFIIRPSDKPLRDAIDSHATGQDSRLLLLVGDPMIGKSRTLLELLRNHPKLIDAWFLIPNSHTSNLAQIAQVASSLIGPSLLWLDDIQNYRLNTDTLQILTNTPQLFVAGTLRTDQRRQLQDDHHRMAHWQAITNTALVNELRHPREWTEQDFRALYQTHPSDLTIDAVTRGQPLGEHLGAATELLQAWRDATPQQAALINLVADWPRIGRTDALPEDQARELFPTYLSTHDQRRWKKLTIEQQDERWNQLLQGDLTTKPIAGARPLLENDAEGLATDAYLTWEPKRPLPRELFEHALKTTNLSQLLQVAFRAYHLGDMSVQLEALRRIEESKTWINACRLSAADMYIMADRLPLALTQLEDVVKSDAIPAHRYTALRLLEILLRESAPRAAKEFADQKWDALNDMDELEIFRMQGAYELDDGSPHHSAYYYASMDNQSVSMIFEAVRWLRREGNA